jgi:hypothetical protein
MIKINKKTGLILGISACIIIILFITLALTKQFPGQKSKSDKKPTSTTSQQNFKNYYDIENFEINVSDNVNYIKTETKEWRTITSIDPTPTTDNTFIYGYNIIPMKPTKNIINSSDTITNDLFNLYSGPLPLNALTQYNIKIQSFSFMINNLNSAITDVFEKPLINIKIYDKNDNICIDIKEPGQLLTLKTKLYNNNRSIMYYFDEKSIPFYNSSTRCNIDSNSLFFKTTKADLNSTTSPQPNLTSGQNKTYDYYIVISLNTEFVSYLQTMINYSNCIISDINGIMALRSSTDSPFSGTLATWVPSYTGFHKANEKELINKPTILNISDLFPDIYPNTPFNGIIYGYKFVPLSIKTNLINTKTTDYRLSLYSGPVKLSSNRTYKCIPNYFKFDVNRTNFTSVPSYTVKAKFYIYAVSTTTTTNNNTTTTNNIITAQETFLNNDNNSFELERNICGGIINYTLNTDSEANKTKSMLFRTAGSSNPSPNVNTLYCLVAEIDSNDRKIIPRDSDTFDIYIINLACSFIIEPQPLTAT